MRTKSKAVAVFLTMVLVSTCVTGAPAKQPQGGKLLAGSDTNAFTFVVIGDSRPGLKAYPEDPSSASVVYMEHILWINRINSDFSINVGDLIYGHEDIDVRSKQWDSFDKASKLFDKPYFMVVGNHDLDDAASMALYNKRYGALYYSFDHKGCHFTVLSTEMQGGAEIFESTQVAWLEKDLAKAKAQGARQCFVFQHRPVWSDGSRYSDDTRDYWKDRILPILKKYEVDSVFAGHDHYYLADRIDGIRHIITGGGGAELRGWRETGAFYHFLEVTVPSKGRPTITVHERDETFPETIVTKEKRNKWFALVDDFQPKNPLILGAAKWQRTRFSLGNPFTHSIDLDVTWRVTTNSGAIVKPLTRTIHLEPGDRKDMHFKLALKNAEMWSPIADWVIRRPGKEAIRMPSGITSLRASYYTMDKVSDRADTHIRAFDRRQVVAGSANWTGQEDASLDVSLVRLDDAFVIKMKVVDDVLRSDGKYNFQKDSVEAYFDLRPSGKRRTAEYGRGVFQIMVPVDTEAKGPTAVEPEFGKPKDAVPGASAISTVIPGKGYEVEITIPFSGLKEAHYLPGKEFNFDVGINDSDDGPNRDSQLMWSGTGANYHNATAFGKVSRAK